MGTRSVETIQARLKDLGYYAGPIDDQEGPATDAAMTAFKEAHGYWARPYAGPLTLALLFSDAAKVAPRTIAANPPWYELALSKRGLHERTNNVELRSWLRSDGYALGDPAQLPWCGDLVETSIRLTLPDENIPENPYLARNWLKFGRSCDPVKGAVCVFWRGSRSGTSGHVGFVAGEDASAIHVLGGNQSDAVTIARLGRDRLLGCRWPLTYPMDGERVALDAVGELSTNET